MLEADNTVLLVIDVQGKLARLMDGRDELLDNLARLIKGASVLDVPVICTEQNPGGLGPTVGELSGLISSTAIPKLSFSCCGEQRFTDALIKLGRRHILVSGIEAHICVYQTTVELIQLGYDVHVVADAVSSRTACNRDIGLRKATDAGAVLTSAETALFELLKVAEGDKFKAVLDIVK